MQIRVSPTDGVPIYLQIVNQVKYLVASGRLGRGRGAAAHPRARRAADRSTRTPSPAPIASWKSPAS